MGDLELMNQNHWERGPVISSLSRASDFLGLSFRTTDVVHPLAYKQGSAISSVSTSF